jgi:cation diffusion facilitator CzcD-associated flavoprotein CzcO
MCDIESYLYLPLLEETGYIPKHRYAQGDEIRKYANLIAEKWNITNSAIFQTKAENLVWDEATKEWQVQLVQKGKGMQPQTLNIRSQSVVMVSGVLSWPQLPKLPGILDYQGQTFHSSRWDYSITGGSQEDPSLEKLKDKRIAIIGTGASAIQIVPHLARWSKHLYVVQRTPSAVDHRDQRKTDVKWFQEKVATSQEWQRERMRNFHQQFTAEDPPATNLVDDGWTHTIGLLAIVGNPVGPKTVDEIPAYIQWLQAADLPRQNRVRARVETTVKDPNTAKKLQAWYPSWCKRPCFHDDYLPAFNRDNVTLVDTNGKGLDGFTSDSIIAGQDSYPVDLIIFATGFRSPFGGSPAEKANLTITGLNGASMSDEWARDGPTTLHGVIHLNFPNLFLSGPFQAANSPNFLFNIDEMAKDAAYILAKAKQRANGQLFAVAPTADAVEDWATQVAMRSPPSAPSKFFVSLTTILCRCCHSDPSNIRLLSSTGKQVLNFLVMGCTPSYFNMEGLLDRLPPEKQARMARSGLWGHGIEDFLKHLEAWHTEGNMQGIEVRV